MFRNGGYFDLSKAVGTRRERLVFEYTARRRKLIGTLVPKRPRTSRHGGSDERTRTRSLRVCVWFLGPNDAPNCKAITF